MTQAPDFPAPFPKCARLRKRREFQFRPYFRFHGENFSFIYTPQGGARLGISIAKRVLKRATARNRVRRLVREAFRHKFKDLAGFDVHVVARPPLSENWNCLKRQDVEQEFDRFRAWAGRDRRERARRKEGETLAG